MDFRAFVKSIKADVAKKEITITFTAKLDEESLADALELAPYTGQDAGAVKLDVTPYQQSLIPSA